MNYRLTELLSTKTLDTSGTEVIDINTSDPISRLLFEYKQTRGSTTSAEHVAANISKIELVDGSNVIFSLSGKELHALAYYHQKKSQSLHLTNIATIQQLLTLMYDFGRYLWDPILAFDPKRYKNPQLKITHNVATSDASATVHTLRILAFCFDEKVISPAGFLSTREIESFTSGAESSYHYTDLPTDKIIKMMLVRGYYAAYQPWQVANEILLSEDGDKRIPVNESVSLLMKWLNTEWPRCVDGLQAGLVSGTTTFYCTPHFGVSVMGLGLAATAPVIVGANPIVEPFTLNGGATMQSVFNVSGFQPHGVVAVPFGDQMDMDDWYDVTKLGSLKSRIKAGSAGTNGSVQIFLQQLAKYGA